MSRLDSSSIFKSMIDKVRIFFHQQQWKEIMIFLFFLILSASLWCLQSLQQEYEVEITIPVKYKNIPSDVTLSDHNPNAIIVKVKDKGTVLLNYCWLRTFAPLEINVTEIRSEKDETGAVTKRLIESSIAKQLIASTSVIGFEPQSIQVEYMELKSKDLPVQPDIALSMKPGFQLSGAITSVPDQIRVHASSVILDSLSVLKTVYQEITDADKMQEITLWMQEIEGVKMEPNEVRIIIPVEEFTEKRFILPVICTDVPDKYTLRLFKSSVEVKCDIPISRFKDVTENDFKIEIPFREFEENQHVGELPIRLTQKPDWISETTLNPNLIEFIIEQQSQ